MEPLDIIRREVQGLKAGYKEIPSYRIKRFGYVDLQGEGILERLAACSGEQEKRFVRIMPATESIITGEV